MVRFVDSGDESDVGSGDGLAPVTSIFSERGRKGYAKSAADVRQELEDRIPSARRALEDRIPSARPEVERRIPTAEPEREDRVPSAAPIDFDAERSERGRSRAGTGRGSERGQASPAEAAEQGLLKKLRGRQLSVSEAKAYLRQHDLDADAEQALLDAFLARGYLDDARLAEQLVHAGVDRKGQGRRAIAQSLAQRGVPRDVADFALAELPDDDAERALEFARTKAGSMRGLERDVALRRLAGQLARRGYGGPVALDAARQALDEAGRPSGRVRFE
ncbi:regulatory protein RecX [Microbacterium sp. M3]|uniref:Regulatory protein RecX n=1 Tax=Microbacterium arthrosphaerae TaxID=792652 RepID=A0ABU4H194_9MICO|nr:MULTISPECIES: regulatory protein RecX [Microbacterium]MDW4573098.1 regulatory protein RecX [Microbacterium arthrosphaerae]MDW7606953.1 regulatory protein RecX [Microbacterium sp. M3]